MSDLLETKQCTNCKLEILSSNYTIHSVHCHRNIYLCSQCEQPVNHTNKKEHDETNHVTVHCSNCQAVLEKYLLDDHLKNDCPDREVKCQICDIEVKATDITEHENYCGSRTEKCSECGEFVMLKYKSLHIDSNHSFIKLSDEPGPSPSWQYGKRTLCDFLPDLSAKSYKPSAVWKRKSRNSDSSQDKDDFDEVNKRNLVTDEKDDNTESKLNNFFSFKDLNKTNRRDVDEWPALSSLRSLHISEDKLESNLGIASNFKEKAAEEESDIMYAIQVSQEINSDVWRKNESKENEGLKNYLKQFVESDMSTEKVPDKCMLGNNHIKVDSFKNDFNYLYDKHETVKLPCEFCENLIVSNDLFLHQSKCSFRVRENFNDRSERHRGFYFDDDMDKKVPCGMCNKFFRLSLLDNHQLNCQRNPMKSSKSFEKSNYYKNLRTMNTKSEKGIQNGLEPSSPQLARVGTRSEWLSELSKTTDGQKDTKNNLNHPASGVIKKTTKPSRKNHRAPSPPTRLKK